MYTVPFNRIINNFDISEEIENILLELKPVYVNFSHNYGKHYKHEISSIHFFSGVSQESCLQNCYDELACIIPELLNSFGNPFSGFNQINRINAIDTDNIFKIIYT